MRIHLLWICLAVVTLAMPIFAADQPTEQWFAIYMEGGKIGHATHSRTPNPNGTITTVEQVEMTLGRGGMSITSKTMEKCIETVDGKPLSFESVQDMGMMASRSSGKIEGGKMTLTTDVAGQKSTQTVDFPAGALMSEGLRLAGIRHGLKAGTAWKATAFVPSLMEPVDVNIVVGPKVSIDLLGRVAELTQVSTSMSTPAGQIVQISYVNNDFETMKMTTSAMGMSIEMVSCPKEFAIAPVDDVVEFFNKVTIRSPQPLSSMGGVKSIKYYISPESGSKPAFPTTDTQSAKTTPDGSMVLTVIQPASQPAAGLPYAGKDHELLQYLKRSQYVESDDPCVVALTKQAVGSEKDAWKAAKKIEKFVSEHVSDKNLSVGYASAAEVARSKAGDCSEHAVLVAAMCRAVGIPARVVAGLVYADSFGDQQNIFGPHAWAEVNIAGKWYGLDATGAPRGFAPDHIAVAAGDGSPAAFLGLINTIGNFTITKLEVAR